MDKSLPFKMLLDLKNHLGKRGLPMFSRLKAGAPEFLMHATRVCNICYSLVVREHQLIEV